MSPIVKQFQLLGEALFERVQNDDRHVLHLLMPRETERTAITPESQTQTARLAYELITKTRTLKTIIFSFKCFTMIVIDIILVAVLTYPTQSAPSLMRIFIE